MKLTPLKSSNHFSKPINFLISINPSNPNFQQTSKFFFNPYSICYPKHPNFLTLNCFNINTSIKTQNNSNPVNVETLSFEWEFVQIKNPVNIPPFLSSLRSKFSSTDHALFVFTFIACSISAAFVSYVAAAVPTLYAMGRAANSFAKLADTAREELPGTMAAIRLSGLEISDLTLELTDLSQEISDGVDKSTQAVKAAGVAMQQLGALAREQTISMIEERANLPEISLRLVVSGAAKKTSRAVGHATRAVLHLISGGDNNSEENE